MINKRFAFTLAEVLITLGIIGVVAALTIPTLIANTQSAKFRSQYKKSLSIWNQAGIMAENKYATDYSSISNAFGCSQSSLDEPRTISYLKYSWNDMCGFAKSLLPSATISTMGSEYKKNIKLTTVTKSELYLGALPSIKFTDGSMLIFGYMGSCSYSQTIRRGCVAIIDVNGENAPNKEVTCSNTNTIITKDAGDCKVSNQSMGDIFPVIFSDSTVLPATNAAAYVLHNK